MNETPTALQFRDGDGPSVRIGSVNAHGQRCHGTLGVPGTDHNAVVYKLECSHCGFVYGANSGDVWQRKCPNCQGGAPGLRYWLVAREVRSGADGDVDGTRVEYDTVETGADWLERVSGSLAGLPDAEEFLRHCRAAREEGEADGDRGP